MPDLPLSDLAALAADHLSAPGRRVMVAIVTIEDGVCVFDASPLRAPLDACMDFAGAFRAVSETIMEQLEKAAA